MNGLDFHLKKQEDESCKAMQKEKRKYWRCSCGAWNQAPACSGCGTLRQTQPLLTQTQLLALQQIGKEADRVERDLLSADRGLNENELKWETRETKKLLHTAVYDVIGQSEVAANGVAGEYVAIEAPDWVMTVPVYKGQFVMVTQWRHGEDRITVEFPGGVADRGEDPAETAKRELLEETGFRAGKLTHLGTCSPNPALFKNHFHCYLAEDLEPTGEQHPDADELLRCRLMPIEEVIAGFGSEKMTHALMGTALAFYLRSRR